MFDSPDYSTGVGGASSGGGGSTLPVDDATGIAKGSGDATKIVRFEVDGLTTATTRVITMPDADIKLPITTQHLTFTGPTAARSYALPDAAATILTTNAAVTVPQGGSGVATLGTSKQPVLANGTSVFTAPPAPATADSNADVIWAASGTGKKALVLQANGVQTQPMLDIQQSNGVQAVQAYYDGTIKCYHIGQMASNTDVTVFTIDVVGSGARIRDQSAALTGGTLTYSKQHLKTQWSLFTWTNAMIAALGAATSGDITAFTLPAKTIVHAVIMAVTGQAASVTTLTSTLGTNSATFDNYLNAGDLKAAVNTVYGDALSETGVALNGTTTPPGLGHLASFVSTTDVKMHVVSTIENLSAVTGSTGSIWILTSLLP